MPTPDRRPPRDEQRPEIKICGVNACHAVAARRPDDVRRVYIQASLVPAFGPFLQRCAANRIAYHIVEHPELERITQSTHHEGVCFIAREQPPPSLRELLAGYGPRCLVYLDGVQNPHNLGAIVRVCAHFGAAGVLAAGTDHASSTAMLRTAEGGGEWTPVLPIEPGPRPLDAARSAGFRVVATAVRGGRDLYAAPLPPRILILLGSETHGVTPSLQRLADESVRIPGTGHLDSLNVACAASVLLGDWWRTTPRESDEPTTDRDTAPRHDEPTTARPDDRPRRTDDRRPDDRPRQTDDRRPAGHRDAAPRRDDRGQRRDDRPSASDRPGPPRGPGNRRPRPG